MATIDITITIPDPVETRVRDALIKHYTRDGVEPTPAQAINAFRASVRNSLKSLVLQVERQTALDAAKTSVEEVDVT